DGSPSLAETVEEKQRSTRWTNGSSGAHQFLGLLESRLIDPPSGSSIRAGEAGRLGARSP
nr:hypothetical protein [Candidatus Dormibacteraeota bacterium]